MSGQCGTYAGFNRHKNHAETPCDACVTAKKVYMRTYRFRTGFQTDPYRCIECGSVFAGHHCWRSSA